jgi:Calpain family cysteine protease
LSKDRLWSELENPKQEFVFSAGTTGGQDSDFKDGLALGHAYSVLRAVEAVGEDNKRVRLVLIRNPWGKRDSEGAGEWNGPWSDGSKEWTPYWMKKLDYKFGDDGQFWISYQDIFTKFTYLNRTRLFDSSWITVQQWTSVNVAFVSGYMTTKFLVEVTQPGIVVIVLSQVR